MLQTARAVLTLLLSYGLLIVANGLIGTLLGVRAIIEGFSAQVTGLIMTGYFIGLFLGAVLAIRVVANVGHIRAFAAFASVMSVTALGHVLLVDPIAWFFLRIATGFCMAGMVMVVESWLNERADNRSRGQVMALYMITHYLSAGLGQFLLPLADPARFQLFTIVSIIYSIALVPMLLSRAAAPRPAAPERASFSQLWGNSPLGFVGAVSSGLNNSAVYALGAVFAKQIGLSLAQTSMFMASIIFGGMALQWPIGRLSDHIDRRWVLIGVAMTAAVASLLVAQATGGTLWVLFLAAGLFGGASFTVYSQCIAHSNDFADPDRRAQVSGGLLMAYACGAVTGPVLAGAIMQAYNPQAMFYYTGAVNTGLVLFALYRTSIRATLEASKRKGVINLPGGQFTAGHLYSALRDQLDSVRQRNSDTKNTEKKSHQGSEI